MVTYHTLKDVVVITTLVNVGYLETKSDILYIWNNLLRKQKYLAIANNEQQQYFCCALCEGGDVPS